MNRKAKRGRVVFLLIVALVCVCIAAMFAVVGCNYVSNRNFTETFYCVSSMKVNNAVRVLQLTDLHDCTYGDNNTALLERVKKLNPDIIVCTGDMIDRDSPSVIRVLQLAEGLADIAPSFYIYGNHETDRVYRYELTQQGLDTTFGFNDDNRDPQKLLDEADEFAVSLETAGMTVLKNETATVTVGKTEVDVFGVLTDNPSSFWSYAGKNFENYLYQNDNHLKLTALHSPRLFEHYSPDSWGDVMIAGHTHGGLAQIPMVGPLYTVDDGFLPARSGHYTYGRADVQGRPLIVSSGLDNRSFFRINNPPELVVVDINKF